jgi:hypothetical protein
MKGTKIGNLKCEVTQINGEKFTVTMNDVKYVPSLCVNLFRLNEVLKKASRSLMMELLPALITSM